jgi:hypothetical protein
VVVAHPVHEFGPAETAPVRVAYEDDSDYGASCSFSLLVERIS